MKVTGFFSGYSQSARTPSDCLTHDESSAFSPCKNLMHFALVFQGNIVNHVLIDMLESVWFSV
jgi:hypothetical protein